MYRENTAANSEAPPWFRRLLNTYMPHLQQPGMSPDHPGNLNDREKRKFKTYWDIETSIAWRAARRLKLKKPQVEALVARCYDYGFGRTLDAINQRRGLGSTEKEQRRRAKLLAQNLRDIATQIHVIRGGLSDREATESQRLLSGILAPAFLGENRNKSADLVLTLKDWADSIDKCLRDRKPQHQYWHQMRRQALLGDRGSAGEGMVSLAATAQGVDYSALAEIICVLFPQFRVPPGLQGSELEKEVERLSERPPSSYKSGK